MIAARRSSTATSVIYRSLLNGSVMTPPPAAANARRLLRGRGRGRPQPRRIGFCGRVCIRCLDDVRGRHRLTQCTLGSHLQIAHSLRDKLVVASPSSKDFAARRVFTAPANLGSFRAAAKHGIAADHQEPDPAFALCCQRSYLSSATAEIWPCCSAVPREGVQVYAPQRFGLPQ